MASGTDIAEIKAREILDSRGNPTIEVDVRLASGAMGRAAVPSGASTGVHEALELRDGDPKRYRRQGRAQGGRQRQHENRRRARAASMRRGRPTSTPSSSRSTAPRTRPISAPMRCSGSRSRPRMLPPHAKNLPLYRYLNPDAHLMPVPMMNVLNGGSHADSSVDMQEFMIVPVGAPTMADAVRMGAEVFHALAERAEEARAVHQRRRRGRLRAESAQQRGADRGDPRSDCEGRLQARRRCRDRARPGLQRILRRRQIRLRALGQEGAQLRRRDGEVLRRLARALSDRVDRRRPRRGRLGRMGDADEGARREGAAGRRRSSSSPTPSASRAASRKASPIRFLSR